MINIIHIIIFTSGKSLRALTVQLGRNQRKLSQDINPFSTNYLFWTASRYSCYWMCCHPWSAPWCPQNSPSWSWQAWDCGWSCQNLCCSRLFGGRTTWVHSPSCSADFQMFSPSCLCCPWSVAIRKMHGTALDSESRTDTERDLSCKNCLHKTLLVNPFLDTCRLTNSTRTPCWCTDRQVTHHTNTHTTNERPNLEMSHGPSASEGETTRKIGYKI